MYNDSAVRGIESGDSTLPNCSEKYTILVKIALAVITCASLVFGLCAYFQVGAFAHLTHASYYAYGAWSIAALSISVLAIQKVINYKIRRNINHPDSTDTQKILEKIPQASLADGGEAAHIKDQGILDPVPSNCQSDVANFLHLLFTHEHFSYSSNLERKESYPTLFYEPSSTLRQVRELLLEQARENYTNIPINATYRKVKITIYEIRDKKYHPIQISETEDDNVLMSDLVTRYPAPWHSIRGVRVTFPFN